MGNSMQAGARRSVEVRSKEDVVMKPLCQIAIVILVATAFSSANSAPINDKNLAAERQELQKDHAAIETAETEMQAEHQRWFKLKGGATHDAFEQRDNALLKRHSALLTKHGALIKKYAKIEEAQSSGERGDEQLKNDYASTIMEDRRIMSEHDEIVQERTKMRKERSRLAKTP